MSQGFFESDEDYAKRMAREAAERTVKDASGSSPSQGFFEDDDDYHRRVIREAEERDVEQVSGRRPSQGFFESDDDYSMRISTEASEQRYKNLTGRSQSQGFFEDTDNYRSRAHREAAEAYIKDQSGSGPSHGFFESDVEYHRRIALDANERRTEQAAVGQTDTDVPNNAGGSDLSVGAKAQTTPLAGAAFDWRSIDTIILNVHCSGCDEMEGHYFQYPAIRACKLCGYRAVLDRDWAESVQGMIESGLYMRVGDGRSLIMTQDWASAVHLNSFPKLKRLWDLTRFDPPASPPRPPQEPRRPIPKFFKFGFAAIAVVAFMKLAGWNPFGESSAPPIPFAPTPAQTVQSDAAAFASDASLPVQASDENKDAAAFASDSSLPSDAVAAPPTVIGFGNREAEEIRRRLEREAFEREGAQQAAFMKEYQDAVGESRSCYLREELCETAYRAKRAKELQAFEERKQRVRQIGQMTDEELLNIGQFE